MYKTRYIKYDLNIFLNDKYLALNVYLIYSMCKTIFLYSVYYIYAILFLLCTMYSICLICVYVNYSIYSI